MRLTQKIMLGLFAVILLAGFAVVIEFHARRELVSNAVLDDVQHLEGSFAYLADRDMKILSSTLAALVRDQGLKDVYLAMDRQRLYDYARPLFEELKDKYGITHFYFILPDGRCFLRVHNKDIHDDLIARHSFREAKESGAAAAGIELGKTAFALRAVRPYYDGGRLIGYVEMGEEVGHFLKILKEKSHNEFAMITPKKHLDRADWQSTREAAGTRDNWDDLADYVVMDATGAIKETGMEKVLTEENIRAAESGGPPRELIRMQGRLFGYGGFRIKDIQGRAVGSVLPFIDVTPELNMAGRIHFAMLSSIALLFLYIAVFGLFVFFNISVPIVRLGRAMDKAGKGDMDSRVDIKTGDEIEQLAGSFNQMMADLKFSREELTNEKERLRITLQSIGDGVIATDIAGNVALMNDVAANLTGWTKAEAAGRPVGEVFRIVNQKTRMPCESPIMRAITSGGVVGLANDTVLISRDGTERIILDSGSPIRDSQGNITGGVLVFRDNTEQRNALEGVRKLSRALEFSPAVVLITDPTGRIEYANPKFTALTGYHRGEVIGTTARILRPDKLAPAEHRRLWETISAGKEWRGEFLNKNKKDEPYWESVAISSLKDAGDTVTNFLIVAEDISQSKLFAEKLAEEKKTLEIFHRAAVNQELDALGLKKEVNDLLAAGGRPIKYQEVLEAEGLWDSNPDGDKERQQDA